MRKKDTSLRIGMGRMAITLFLLLFVVMCEGYSITTLHPTDVLAFGGTLLAMFMLAISVF